MARQIGAGSLDRRIEIQRKIEATDAFGGKPKNWSTLIEVWARFLPVSDGEKWRAGMVESREIARFTVRHNRVTAGVTGADQIVFDDRDWGITGTKEVMGRSRFIEITAEAVNED